MNEEQGVAVAPTNEPIIEPSPSSQRDDDSHSERSVKLDDVQPILVEKTDDQVNLNTESDKGDQGSENSAPVSSQEDSQSNSMNQQSSQPVSSRGSTKATNDGDDSLSMGSAMGGDRIYGYHIPDGAPTYPGDTGGPHVGYPVEAERGEDGSLNLTNKYLRDLFRKEPRRYYRTPCLNDKLFLHYKGFSNVKNLEQFINLKCLYFEGNGCRSLTGLEENTALLSLFMQENVIEDMSGLNTLVNLRTLNLADNCIRTITGLSSLVRLDSLYLKSNRIGTGDGGALGDLKGLLECPSLSNVDLSDNRVDDEKCLEEIFVKMPNLLVLYLPNNDITKKIQPYRKAMIAKLPKLRYLDDRPVFEEDRRRAEAYARGGIEEERKEMKLIRKEKDDKHWANHEAFKSMIARAREEKKEKEERKVSMKDMMAEAKKKKEAAAGAVEEAQIDTEQSRLEADRADGKYRYDAETKAEMQQSDIWAAEATSIAEERYREKQAGVETKPDVSAEAAQEEFDNKMNAIRKERAQAFDDAMGQMHNVVKSAQEAKDFAKDKEANPIDAAAEDDDAPPDLEEIDPEELARTKEQKQREWLNNVIAEETAAAEKKEAVKTAPGATGMKIEEVHSLRDEKVPEEADKQEAKESSSDEEKEESDQQIDTAPKASNPEQLAKKFTDL